MRTNTVLGAGMSLFCLMLASCAPPTGVRIFAGAPTFSATPSAEVALLRQEPRRPHVQLGEVWIKPKPGWSPMFVENALRERAASIGAHALVIVVDRVFRDRIVVRNYWRGTRVYRERIIVGIAIRYNP